ncbi:hypothetical protein Q4I30_005045 [Leishmania utingensis]|uniref:Uncharacterized protein n=1 Tax=Leishmania utingensis TaxID=653362 RepID=A0AAW3A9W6_9TRYP
MQTGGAGDLPALPAASGALTDDVQSPRQANAIGTSSEGMTTTSFRAPLPFDRCTISSQQRRGGNLVLFVKSNENESEVASRGTTLGSQQQQYSNGGCADGNIESSSEEGDQSVSKDQERLLSAVVSASAGAIGSVGSITTSAARKPLVIAALVLLYFILLDIVLLSGNERLSRVLRRMRAADDDALILLSTSLVRQMSEAKREVRDAVTERGRNMKVKELAMARQKVEALERACNRSVSRLHAKLMFPGSIDDLFFLIEEHSTYDERLRDLAAHELLWTTTVMTEQVVQVSGGGAEESRSRAPGTTRPATHLWAEDGDELPSVEKENVDAELNSLRNVRLHRVRGNKAPGMSARSSYAQRRYTGARGTAALRWQSGHTNSFTFAVHGAKKALGGLLTVLRNKCVAFVLICVLLSSVLRMG